jgi:hypothetical protein
MEDFLASLEARPHSSTVTNPYRQPYRSDNLRHYLRALLAQPGRRALIVGEALGYRGGLLTGIPISSERLLREQRHPFWRRLGPHLVIEGDTAEATASIVWDYLARRRRIPLFWNAFPFHPHYQGEPNSNRAPSAVEVEEGIAHLRSIIRLYQPDIIAGLGHNGTRAARRCCPDCQVQALRHPSYGGKQQFYRGMERLLAH